MVPMMILCGLRITPYSNLWREPWSRGWKDEAPPVAFWIRDWLVLIQAPHRKMLIYQTDFHQQSPVAWGLVMVFFNPKNIEDFTAVRGTIL
jgi:hypothetical protein